MPEYHRIRYPGFTSEIPTTIMTAQGKVLYPDRLLSSVARMLTAHAIKKQAAGESGGFFSKGSGGSDLDKAYKAFVGSPTTTANVQTARAAHPTSPVQLPDIHQQKDPFSNSSSSTNKKGPQQLFQSGLVSDPSIFVSATMDDNPKLPKHDPYNAPWSRGGPHTARRPTKEFEEEEQEQEDIKKSKSSLKKIKRQQQIDLEKKIQSCLMRSTSAEESVRLLVPLSCSANFFMDAFWWLFLDEFSTSEDVSKMYEEAVAPMDEVQRIIAERNKKIDEEKQNLAEQFSLRQKREQQVSDWLKEGEEGQQKNYTHQHRDEDNEDTEIPELADPPESEESKRMKKVPKHLSVNFRQQHLRGASDIAMEGSSTCKTVDDVAPLLPSFSQNRFSIQDYSSPKKKNLVSSYSSNQHHPHRSDSSSVASNASSSRVSTSSYLSQVMRYCPMVNSHPDLTCLDPEVQKQIVGREQQKLFARMAENYVHLMEKFPLDGVARDAVSEVYCDVVSQGMLLALYKVLPYARRKIITVEFQEKIMKTLTFWMFGVERLTTANRRCAYKSVTSDRSEQQQTPAERRGSVNQHLKSDFVLRHELQEERERIHYEQENKKAAGQWKILGKILKEQTIAKQKTIVSAISAFSGLRRRSSVRLSAPPDVTPPPAAIMKPKTQQTPELPRKPSINFSLVVSGAPKSSLSNTAVFNEDPLGGLEQKAPLSGFASLLAKQKKSPSVCSTSAEGQLQNGKVSRVNSFQSIASASGEKSNSNVSGGKLPLQPAAASGSASVVCGGGSFRASPLIPQHPTQGSSSESPPANPSASSLHPSPMGSFRVPNPNSTESANPLTSLFRRGREARRSFLDEKSGKNTTSSGTTSSANAVKPLNILGEIKELKDTLRQIRKGKIKAELLVDAFGNDLLAAKQAKEQLEEEKLVKETQRMHQVETVVIAPHRHHHRSNAMPPASPLSPSSQEDLLALFGSFRLKKQNKQKQHNSKKKSSKIKKTDLGSGKGEAGQENSSTGQQKKNISSSSPVSFEKEKGTICGSTKIENQENSKLEGGSSDEDYDFLHARNYKEKCKIERLVDVKNESKAEVHAWVKQLLDKNKGIQKLVGRNELGTDGLPWFLQGKPVYKVGGGRGALVGGMKGSFGLKEWSPLVHRYMLLCGEDNGNVPIAMRWTYHE